MQSFRLIKSGTQYAIYRNWYLLSPFVRKVYITMQLKGIKFEVDPASPFNLPEGYEKINPLKPIPMLKHDEQYIYDSAVICRHLDDIHPEIKLISTRHSLKAQTG